MGISLKEMLSSVVAIPYEDSLLEIIEKGCQSYIDEIEDSYVDVQELALSFIYNTAAKLDTRILLK